MDRVTPETRSQIMSNIRSRGNRSTEKRLRAALVRAGLSGWCMHPENMPGTPDFYFREQKVAIFVDGCFWHGCPSCYRRPQSRQEYWDNKLKSNKARDERVDGELHIMGIVAIRVWEHQVADDLTSILDKVRLIMKKN